MAKSGKESCRSAQGSDDFWEMEVAIRDQLPEEGSWVVVDYSMPYAIKTASTEWWERTTLWPCSPSICFQLLISSPQPSLSTGATCSALTQTRSRGFRW